MRHPVQHDDESGVPLDITPPSSCLSRVSRSVCNSEAAPLSPLTPRADPIMPRINKQLVVLILSLLLNLLQNTGVVTPLSEPSPACPPAAGVEPAGAALPQP